MPLRQKVTIEQGHIVRKRDYPLRNPTLELNKKLQSETTVKNTDGARAFANFPDHEIERLAEKGRTDRDTPSWYADLDSKDAQISSRAIKRLVNSKDGECYRVGSTSRKTFKFKSNPLAKDR